MARSSRAHTSQVSPRLRRARLPQSHAPAFCPSRSPRGCSVPLRRMGRRHLRSARRLASSWRTVPRHLFPVTVPSASPVCLEAPVSAGRTRRRPVDSATVHARLSPVLDPVRARRRLARVRRAPTRRAADPGRAIRRHEAGAAGRARRARLTAAIDVALGAVLHVVRARRGLTYRGRSAAHSAEAVAGDGARHLGGAREAARRRSASAESLPDVSSINLLVDDRGARRRRLRRVEQSRPMTSLGPRLVHPLHHPRCTACTTRDAAAAPGGTGSRGIPQISRQARPLRWVRSCESPRQWGSAAPLSPA